MSYMIQYERQSEDEKIETYDEIISDSQLRIVQQIPWIKLVSTVYSNKAVMCSSLR